MQHLTTTLSSSRWSVSSIDFRSMNFGSDRSIDRNVRNQIGIGRGAARASERTVPRLQSLSPLMWLSKHSSTLNILANFLTCPACISEFAFPSPFGREPHFPSEVLMSRWCVLRRIL